jgi:Eukaryotic aspartyl protease
MIANWTSEYVGQNFQMGGTIIQDTLIVGGMAIPSQTFVCVDTPVLIPLYIYGVIGLAFQPLAVNGTTPLFDNLIAQDLIADQV